MGRFVKYLLMTLNLGVFIAGGTLFVAGLLLKLDTGLLHHNVVILWNHIQYKGVYLGTIAHLVTLWMIILGGFMMGLAILGWCGAWKKVRGLLIAYIVIVLVLVAAEGAMIGLWVTVRGRSTEWLRGQMLSLLKSYNGPGYTDDISSGWDHLFIYGRCCGVAGQYENGGTQNDFNEQSSTWYTTNRDTSGTGELVPATCCQGATTDNYASYINSATCTASATTPSNYYVTGCYDKTVSAIHTYSLITIITTGIVFIIKITAIIAACMRMDKTSTTVVGHPPPGPPPYVSIDAVLKNKKLRR